jgi:hypothetical protein
MGKPLTRTLTITFLFLIREINFFINYTRSSLYLIFDNTYHFDPMVSMVHFKNAGCENKRRVRRKKTR